MPRTRIERLEERKMFSVTDLILDPFNSAVSATIDGPTAIVDFIDVDEISAVTGRRARTESVVKDASITIGGARTESIALGDVNNDGRADGITPTYNGDLLSVVAADFNGDGRDDLANLVGGQEGEEVVRSSTEVVPTFWLAVGPNIHDLAGNKLVRGTGFESDDPASNLIIVVCITDGLSNTLMFGDTPAFVAPVHLDLLGVHVDTSPISLSVMGLDTWEHAYLFQDEPAGDGIRALLPAGVTIPTGTVTFGLTADPSDPNTVYVNSFFAYGAPHFIRVDTSNMADAQSALVVSNSNRSNMTAALLGSNEYFSRFASTTLDAQTAALSVLFGNGDGTFKATHDAQFETGADMSRFGRGHLPVTLVEVLVAARHVS